MSRAASPSTTRCYGTARVCRVRELPRSTVYAQRARAAQSSRHHEKRGPRTAWTDVALTEQICAVLACSPFVGEGYRKVWARLRVAGVRTARGRVLRLMRGAGLLAPTRVGRRRGPQVHDGTIRTARPDELWGTDATSWLTTAESTATVFIAVDDCTQECVGIHAARPGTRFEALEPLRLGIRPLRGLRTERRRRVRAAPRPRQPVQERPLPGRAALPRHPLDSGVCRHPEGNGRAERFIRTLEEQLLWLESFATVEQLRLRPGRLQAAL